MAQEMSIGEVARRAGIRPSAIRYYESMGVLPPARLVHTKRLYTADIFPRLTLIKIAQQAGFTVKEMRLLLNSHQGDGNLPGGWRALAQKKLLEIETRMQQLGTMRSILQEALHQEHLTTDEAIDRFTSLIH